MPKVNLTVNGQMIRVNQGDTLVDAALRGRIVIPHECCAGQCDTCRVEVLEGTVDALGTERGKSVQACMARVEGDASIQFDEVPHTQKLMGEVSAIRPLSPEIYEVLVRLPRDFTYLPGQYVSLSFKGFPSRDYSPTVFEDGTQDLRTLVFHIKKYEGGLISSQIGKKIHIGTKVALKGPYGHAFYRESNNKKGRLILIGTGTGFAPLWSLACEAVTRNTEREIHLIIGAQDAANLYMPASLEWLAARNVTNITLCASKKGFDEGVKRGRPTDFLPKLHAEDRVYAAGVPAMVENVTQLALHAQATVYADPFTMSYTGLSLYNRLQQMMMSPVSKQGLSPFTPRTIENPSFQPQTTQKRNELPKTQHPRKTQEQQQRKVVNR